MTWREELHPRDVRGRWTNKAKVGLVDNPDYDPGPYIRKKFQQHDGKTIHEMSANEFLEAINPTEKWHASDFLDRHGGMDVKGDTEEYGALVATRGDVEYRRSTDKAQYVTKMNGSIVRDPETGLAIFMSDEEAKEAGLPVLHETLQAFIDGEAVGYVFNSFGAAELYVEQAYRGRGIGADLCYLWYRDNPFFDSGGMSDAGRLMAEIAYWRITRGSVPQRLINLLHQRKQIDDLIEDHYERTVSDTKGEAREKAFQEHLAYNTEMKLKHRKPIDDEIKAIRDKAPSQVKFKDEYKARVSGYGDQPTIEIPGVGFVRLFLSGGDQPHYAVHMIRGDRPGSGTVLYFAALDWALRHGEKTAMGRVASDLTLSPSAVDARVRFQDRYGEYLYQFDHPDEDGVKVHRGDGSDWRRKATKEEARMWRLKKLPPFDVSFDHDKDTARSLKMTALTPQQRSDRTRKGWLKRKRAKKKWIDPTKTANFKKWFGKSKVVDKNGDPMPMYHATKNEMFEEFDSPVSPGYNYFTDTPEYAEAHHIMHGVKSPTERAAYPFRTQKVFLKIENPLDLREFVGVRDEFEEFLEERGIDFSPSKFHSMSPTHGYRLVNEIRRGGVFQSKRFIEAAKKAGYDGLVFWDEHVYVGSNNFWEQVDATTYIAFDANQVKSATGNTGAFDPNDDRFSFMVSRKNLSDSDGVIIREAEASEIPKTFIHRTEDAADIESIKQAGFDLKKFGRTAKKFNSPSFLTKYDPRGVYATSADGLDLSKSGDKRPYVVFKANIDKALVLQETSLDANAKKSLSDMFSGKTGAALRSALLKKGYQAVLRPGSEQIILDPSIVEFVE